MSRSSTILRVSTALRVGAVLAALLHIVAPAGATAQSLKGSPASLDRQNRVAAQHDYSFLETPERVRFFVEKGWLVRIRPTRDYTLYGVSYPYARPQVTLFLERLGGQYRSACGEQLVVTSLTRPLTEQPRNASDRSVHPTGMAIDLRYPRNRTCRAWLEDVLLSLERGGILEATRERSPVHYHVALFPQQYATYVQQVAQQVAQQRSDAFGDKVAYRVRRGDSLWTIARSHGTTVDELQEANGLSGNKIFAGQVIEVPLGL